MRNVFGEAHWIKGLYINSRKGWGMLGNNTSQDVHLRGTQLHLKHVTSRVLVQHFVVICSNLLNKFWGAFHCCVCLAGWSWSQGLAKARELFCCTHPQVLGLTSLFLVVLCFSNLKDSKMRPRQGKTICQISAASFRL